MSSGALVVDLEECEGGRTACESSGKEPDLDVFENSWIDTTEWHIHAIVLRTSTEVVTHPSEGRGG